MRGLLVGRFQPFHEGHLRLLRHIRDSFRPEALFVGIGSAQHSHTFRNPFTAGERFEMILRVLREEALPDTWPVPVPDVDRHAVWVAHVASLLPPFEEVYSNDPLTRHLFESAGYRVPELPLFERTEFQGTLIRERMREGRPWETLVPPPVRRYLEEIKGAERVRMLARSVEAFRTRPEVPHHDAP